eukprot:CAMPEP_0198266788 /NCGR_PEP_ID=MMETSP1447-20131203/30089_1 /TAXON_ID=420782 /ORGANISM="Chaetoceros dichaeta, Strain CCMP1751" /LENGTH=327 /DNA_ID=CAMNT_0043957037 /DNA_START=116 /DNA_END=1099 /DNA_ORIENTATION=+
MTWFKNPSAVQENEDDSFRPSPLSLLTDTSNSKSKTSKRSTRARRSTGVAVPNLLLLLLEIYCCCSYIVEAQVVLNPIASMTDRCNTVKTQAIVGCNSVNVDLYSFHVKYPDVVAGGEDLSNWDGAMECAMPLTLKQSAKEPTLSRHTTTSEVDEEYYTVLLVDTTADSSSHPILHYGASNVQFDRTNDMVLSNLSPFSGYRGPSSPGGVQRSELFATYEWIVAKQASGKIVEQELRLALNFGRQGKEEFEFDYDRYLSEERGVNATMVFSTYFRSGACVDPTTIGTIIQEFLDKMEIALSSGYPPLSSSLSKVMALVTSALFVFLL